MQKGGVIMDVMNAEQAKIAEAAGAVQLWHWNVFLPISVRQVELPVWQIRDCGRSDEGCFDSGYGKSTYRSFCRS